MSELRTAFDVAMERSKPAHIIPPITDPLGTHWKQPNRFGIIIDDTHAVMDRATFEQLAEYSCSNPTGVYPGKMWMYDAQAYRSKDLPQLAEDERYILRWYGEDTNPEFCSNHSRKILIV